jgi:molybdate transport system permease protein
VLVIAASVALILYLTVPLGIVVVRSVVGGDFLDQLGRPIVYEALRLSLITSVITLAVTIIIGTPIAYLLARFDFAGKRVLDTIIDLPMILPPAVAGIALLIAFGRTGPIGQGLLQLGISLPFTTAAVIMAQVFVACPFYIRAARGGFEGVDVRLEQVSATLGASSWTTFWRVTFPLALPPLLGGAVMAWARALGEFGATIMFAGNFIGRTQTMPLAIYVALQEDVNSSLALATILVIVSFAVLLGFRWLVRRQLEAPLHA